MARLGVWLAVVGLAACAALAAAGSSPDVLVARLGTADLGAAWRALFPPLVAKPWAEVQAELLAENEWKNSLVVWMIPDGIRAQLPLFVQVRRVRAAVRWPPPPAAARRGGRGRFGRPRTPSSISSSGRASSRRCAHLCHRPHRPPVLPPPTA